MIEVVLPHGPRTWRYADLIGDEEFGPVPWVVDDHAVKAYAFAVEDHRPWYSGSSPFDAAVAPPLALGNALLRIYKTVYGKPGDRLLHTRSEVWWHRPLFVGERVDLRGRYVERSVRRGNGYVVLEATAFAADGAPVVTQRATEMTPLDLPPEHSDDTPRSDSGGRITGEIDAASPPAPRARIDLREGTPLPQLRRRIRQDQVTVFSADGYQADLHTSPTEAARFGFRRPVLQGLHQAAVLTDLLTSFFGASLFHRGTLDVRFVRPVLVGDTLAAQGVVAGRTEENDGTRLAVDVWVRDQKGALTTVGTASAVLRST